MKKNSLFSTLVICLLMLVQTAFAQTPETQSITTQVSKARWLGKISNLGEKLPDLKTDKLKRSTTKKNKPKIVDNFAGVRARAYFNEDAQPKNGDPLVKLPSPEKSFSVPVEAILNFDGVNQGEAAGVLPPDTNGDVGPNHYFQCTNGGGGTTIKIFDKEGNLVYGPASGSIFWEDIGLPALGDPIVLYDQFTERWMFSEFATQANTAMLIAYSETSDPLGDWNAYAVTAPEFPDYPKFGVWPDHLIITTNEPTSASVPVYVLDKMAMVNGEEDVDMVRLTGLEKFGGGGFQVAGAIDADGTTTPPATTKPMAIRIYDDAWEGGQDQLELWEIDVDWSNPSTASISNIASLNTVPFDSDLCQGTIFDCVEQPDGLLISVIPQVTMHRSQYRNFGAYETIVCNHTIDVTGGSVAGVRWTELRKYPGGDWEIYQEGTLGDNVNSRFLASCALDGNGNMGIGYGITGADKFLSLRFSGRKSSDPLGTLSIDENEFITGQANTPFHRWGDYSAIAVDPVNDRTFWYTGEYMSADGSWNTRIVTFEVNRDTIDVGPFAIENPVSSAFLTDAESVAVQFKNYGLTQQGNFDISYSVNGSTPVVENINVVLDPDSMHTHTFVPTVDMSALGGYQFKIWSSLNGDQNMFNDTISRTITQLTRWDAGISSINGIDAPICASEHEITYVLRNYGQDEMTGVNINLSLNGGTVITIPWTGSLGTGESTELSFLLNDLVDGTNTIEINTSDPNGLVDQEMGNDGLSRNFEVIFAGATITLNLLTDLFGLETSWEVRDLSGNLLQEGDGYLSETLFIESWCLPNGCYNFTIFDAYGDGICCGFGEGSYEIVDENGIVLASGGEFGSSETKNFCFPFECTVTATADTANESAVGANDGTIMVTSLNTSGTVFYSLNGGPPQTSAVFSNLPGDDYTITVTDGNNCEYTFEVVIETCTMQVTYEVEPPTSTSSQDGTITFNVVDANGPVEYSFNGGITYQESNVFENVGPGNFILVVRDIIGCTFNEAIQISVLTDTENLTFGQSVAIFPNPTKGVIQVEIKGLTDTYYLDYEVYNLLGKRVSSGMLNAYNGVITGKVSILNYPEGTYLLKFIHPDLRNLHKLVKVE